MQKFLLVTASVEEIDHLNQKPCFVLVSRFAPVLEHLDMLRFVSNFSVLFSLTYFGSFFHATESMSNDYACWWDWWPSKLNQWTVSRSGPR